MEVTPEVIRNTVVQTMSFFEDEIVEAVTSRYKDKMNLPITDINATLRQLVDITREEMARVLEFSPPTE